MVSQETGHDQRTPLLGHEESLDILRQGLRNGHLAHAWIFHGPEGIGKRTVAIRLAELLLDPATGPSHVDDFSADQSSETVQLVHAGTHPDLHLIRKELAQDSIDPTLRSRKMTNIPIDLLRERMLGGMVGSRTCDASVSRTPYLGHNKVFIIDEAELLDEPGQAALLKTLEEPPDGTYIILVTTMEHRLLPTIRSRCQRLGFGPLDQEHMRACLEHMAESVDGNDLDTVVRFAEGSPGMASIAIEAGIPGWINVLEPMLQELDSGGYPVELSNTLSELAGEYAETLAKKSRQASKEAANRRACRLLISVLLQRSRNMIRAAIDQEESMDRIDLLMAVVELLSQADRRVGSNVQMKVLMADLVAQWASLVEQHSGHALESAS